MFGWLRAARPVTYVLTDGSGATGRARIDPTTEILRDAGASRGNVFGALSDVDAYAAIRDGDAGVFCRIAESIASDLVARDIRSVAGDALEGYNPVHDVCRLVIDAAVAIASRVLGNEIENWSFPLLGAPDVPGDRRVDLTRDVFEEKMRLAESYHQLAPDVVTAISDFGRDAFRAEVFMRVKVSSWDDRRFLDEQPFYEIHGEARVREGKYRTVIRYRDHVVPIAEMLRDLADANPSHQQHAR